MPMMYERIATLVPVGGAGTGRAFSIDASVDGDSGVGSCAGGAAADGLQQARILSLIHISEPTRLLSLGVGGGGV